MRGDCPSVRLSRHDLEQNPRLGAVRSLCRPKHYSVTARDEKFRVDFVWVESSINAPYAEIPGHGLHQMVSERLLFCGEQIIFQAGSHFAGQFTLQLVWIRHVKVSVANSLNKRVLDWWRCACAGQLAA